jgi:hypothetical protein
MKLHSNGWPRYLWVVLMLKRRGAGEGLYISGPSDHFDGTMRIRRVPLGPWIFLFMGVTKPRSVVYCGHQDAGPRQGQQTGVADHHTDRGGIDDAGGHD